MLEGAAIIFYRIQLAISFVLLVFSLCQFLLIMKTEFGRVQDFTCYTVSTDFQWFIFYTPVASNIVSVAAVSFFLLILFFNIFHWVYFFSCCTKQTLFFIGESIKLEAEQRNVRHYDVIRFILSAECSPALATWTL